MTSIEKKGDTPSHFSTDDLKKLKWEGIRVVIGGILIHMVLGTFYLWGGISTYVASYYKSIDSSVTISMMQMVFPFMGLTTNAFLSFGVKLAERFGHRLVMAIGIAAISGAVFLVSFIQNVYLFIGIYAVVVGVSSGILYMLPIQCGLKYFPAYKGRISGVTVAGYGFGSFIFNFVAQAIVNPENAVPNVKFDESGKTVKYFSAEVYNQVPEMFRILSGCYLVIGAVAILLVKYPKDLHLELHEEHDTLTKDGQKAVVPVDHDCPDAKTGLKSIQFWLMFVMVMCSPFWGLLMANSYKTYGFALGKTDSFLTLVGSLQSVCNGCSRMLWGFTMDRFGFRRVYFVLLLTQLAVNGTIQLVASNDGLYLVWVCLTMFLEGGQYAIFPAETTKIFGHVVGPVIYGAVFMGFAFANLFAFLAYKFLYPIIDWPGVFWMAFGLTIAALVLNLLFREKTDWENAKLDDIKSGRTNSP